MFRVFRGLIPKMQVVKSDEEGLEAAAMVLLAGGVVFLLVKPRMYCC